MSKYNFNEKIEILKRNLERRLEKLPEFKTNLQQNLSIFEKERTLIIDKLKQYGTDDYIKEMLQNNLNYIDTQYEKELAELRTEIERLDASVPVIEKFLGLIQHENYNSDTLDAFIDLFLERTIDDWVELESQANQEK